MGREIALRFQVVPPNVRVLLAFTFQSSLAMSLSLSVWWTYP